MNSDTNTAGAQAGGDDAPDVAASPSRTSRAPIALFLFAALAVGAFVIFMVLREQPPDNSFSLIAEQSFSCAGQTHKVAVYRSERFANALGIAPGQRDPACEFVLIPAGSYVMGFDGDYHNEKPAHPVTIKKPFLLARTEVSQAVWKAVMKKSPADFRGPRRPVENVTWGDCVEFCKYTELRLPSEAEWEYACRAGTSTTYFWGPSIDDSYCWYKKNCYLIEKQRQGTREVTEHCVNQRWNAFGLVDMLGGVLEWCQDDYIDNYDGNSPADQRPRQQKSPKYKTFRGGCWSFDPASCRSSSRSGNSREYASQALGFRPAKTFEPKMKAAKKG